jgi:hypothetical protein
LTGAYIVPRWDCHPTRTDSGMFRFLVTSYIVHPVTARPGDVLVVRPGDPDLPIAVARPTPHGWHGVRVGPPNFGALAGLIADGVLIPQTSAAARWRIGAA